MKLTNGEIFNAREPLEKLMASKPPFEISYGLATLAAKLNDQLGVIDKVRQGLFQTYGVPNPQNPMQLIPPPALIVETDADGNEIKDKAGNVNMVPNPKLEKFASEHGELMAKETEIVLDVVEIPSTIELEIEPSILLALLKFIKMVKK